MQGQCRHSPKLTVACAHTQMLPFFQYLFHHHELLHRPVIQADVLHLFRLIQLSPVPVFQELLQSPERDKRLVNSLCLELLGCATLLCLVPDFLCSAFSLGVLPNPICFESSQPCLPACYLYISSSMQMRHCCTDTPPPKHLVPGPPKLSGGR